MTKRIALQKLLHPGLSSMVRDRGFGQVGGYVTEAAAACELSTPVALRPAYGFADDGDPWVDVVRFALPACDPRSAADSDAARGQPARSRGFVFGP